MSLIKRALIVVGSNATDAFQDFKLRVGIAVGPVIAGVVGASKPTYDIWGDTVNVASRLESSGIMGRIQVSEQVAATITRAHAFQVECRGLVEVKGKRMLTTYLVHTPFDHDHDEDDDYDDEYYEDADFDELSTSNDASTRRDSAKRPTTDLSSCGGSRASTASRKRAASSRQVANKPVGDLLDDAPDSDAPKAALLLQLSESQSATSAPEDQQALASPAAATLACNSELRKSISQVELTGIGLAEDAHNCVLATVAPRDAETEEAPVAPVNDLATTSVVSGAGFAACGPSQTSQQQSRDLHHDSDVGDTSQQPAAQQSRL